MSSESVSRNEKTNDWHPLPLLIGDAITGGEGTGHACGGYLVVRDEDAVRIYHELEMAPTVEDLDNEGDRMWEFGDDFVTGNELVAELPTPEDGWESETDTLPEDIFGGYE